MADGKGPARRVPARALEDLDLPGSRDESSDQAGRFSFEGPPSGSLLCRNRFTSGMVSHFDEVRRAAVMSLCAQSIEGEVLHIP